MHELCLVHSESMTLKEKYDQKVKSDPLCISESLLILTYKLCENKALSAKWTQIIIT